MAETKAPKPKKEAAARPKTAKPAPKKAAKPAKSPAKPTAPGPAKPDGFNPYGIVFHPIVTEKAMFNMDKTNSLEFLVAIPANKTEIKRAIEELFAVKVQKVQTRIAKDGKRATVRFAEGYSAEEVGMRIGVF